MGRLDWRQLPDGLQQDIADHVGGTITEIRVFKEGQHSDFTGAVTAARRTALVKAARLDNEHGTHVHAAALRGNRFLPRSAPRVLWTFSTLEWLVTGYQFTPGRHASLAPGSPDLPFILRHLANLSEHHPGQLAQLDSLVGRWSRESPWRTLSTTDPRVLERWERARRREFIDRELTVIDVLAGGTAVAHTDVHESNLIMGRSDVRLVGWTWACRAPAWVDSALFAVRLVEAGHEPGEAEELLAQVPAWKSASHESLDAFAVSLLGMWIVASRYPSLTNAARKYAQYRLGEF